MDQVRRVGIVVPVHDEERRLRNCLDAIGVAVATVPEPVSVIVVLDACTDRSAAIAAEFAGCGVDTLVVTARSVGQARGAGMAELISRHGVQGLWLATTDADSTIPANWLAAQLCYAASGYTVVAGTVTVADWEDRGEDVRIRAVGDYDAVPHRHIHGANLSFTAAAYRAAGGFPPLRCHEDVGLVEAFVSNGESIAWATDLPITTSARRNARAPHGFASYLSSLESAGKPSGQRVAETDLPRAI